MLRRYLCLVRAWSAAGLLTSSLFGAALVAPASAEPEEPAPTKAFAAPLETVSVLQASKVGDLAMELRGAGETKVQISLKNTSDRKLKVVLPPGLVASSVTGQGRGGGFQSMGLGAVGNRPGSFGEFRKPADPNASGFRSVGVTGTIDESRVVNVPVGQTVELTVPGVCLNYGVRTPNARDKFELMDVDDYTTDVRARKALRTLATYGTSQGVAQAAMWRVCNDVPFATLLQANGKTLNPAEIALAARFVDALDASGSSDLVDPGYMTEGRLYVRVTADSALAQNAARLSQDMEGLKIFGLPVRAVSENDDLRVAAPAVLLNVALMHGANGETKARVSVSQMTLSGEWAPLGKTSFSNGAPIDRLDSVELARALDKAVGSAFVSVKVARRTSNSTTLKIENRLPLTLSGLVLRSGDSLGDPAVRIDSLGVAPGRSALVPFQAPNAILDHLEFNGL